MNKDNIFINVIIVLAVVFIIIMGWTFNLQRIERSEFVSDCRNLSESLEAFDFDIEGRICILTFCGNGTEINGRTFVDECYTKEYKEPPK